MQCEILIAIANKQNELVSLTGDLNMKLKIIVELIRNFFQPPQKPDATTHRLCDPSSCSLEARRN